jgi:hypothetical protein
MLCFLYILVIRVQRGPKVRHVARAIHHANVARTCHMRCVQQGMLLLDPSVHARTFFDGVLIDGSLCRARVRGTDRNPYPSLVMDNIVNDLGNVRGISARRYRALGIRCRLA